MVLRLKGLFLKKSSVARHERLLDLGIKRGAPQLFHDRERYRHQLECNPLDLISSLQMSAKKLTGRFGYAALFALFFMICSGLPSVAVGAENSSPGKSDTLDNGRAEQEVGPSAKISSETVRSYINWIIQQTGWPATGIPPIKMTSFAHLRELAGLSSDVEWIRPAAFYSKSDHLIYLADSWNKDNVVDQSILVHELVHHLQIEDHIQFACWGRYEAQAYELQIQWLRSQGVKDPHNLLHASKASIESLAECP